jgi:hypothetical protein
VRKKCPKTHVYRAKFEALWNHAIAGNLLAIIPSNDSGEALKADRRLFDAGLSGWFGFGISEFGPEDFVVATAEKNAIVQLRAFVRCVQHDRHVSAIVAEGFDVTLFLPICREGKTKAVLQWPFGLSSRTEKTPSGSMVLTFEPPAPHPQPRQAEWFEKLQKAYCDIQGYSEFWFEGSYE